VNGCQPSAPITEWIDVAGWRRTLESGAAEAVMAAWRVSALDEWLRTREDARCIR
jgi:hypothetical protein